MINYVQTNKAIDEYFDANIFPIYVQQMHLLDKYQNSSVEFDLSSSKLHFSNGDSWQVQILGLEMFGSWLWSWADNSQKVPDKSTTLAKAVKSFGEKYDIEQLTTPNFTHNDCRTFGHKICVTACSILGNIPYYVCEINNANVFVCISDINYPARKDNLGVQEISILFPQMLEDHCISNQKISFINALKHYKFKITENLIWKIQGEKDSSIICGKFDIYGRITEVFCKN